MLRVVLFLVAAACASVATAEVCPDTEPTAIGGRVLVWEDNLEPPALRGVGEVYVYAFEPGDSTEGTRYMAVSDGDGYFCIHDTYDADWVVTSFEPFTYRPFVREIHCQPGACDLGDIQLDQTMVRISDDYVDYQDGWWGGPFAQTVVMPAGAENLVKVSMRSACESTNDVNVYEWGGSGPAVGISVLQFPSTAGGGRATAFFQPGDVQVTPGVTYQITLDGGSAAYRADGDIYPDGEMLWWDSDIWVPISGTDLCLTLDVDGPDGNLTNFISGGQDGWVYGSTVGQSFVARSESITHASFVVGSPCDFCRIKASISQTFDGPAIGPTKETTGLHEQGVAFAWFEGEVPVEPGHTYFIRYNFPVDWSVAYTWSQDAGGNDPYASGEAYADGAPQGVDLWGRILGPAESTQSDDDDDDDVSDDDASDDDAQSDDDSSAGPWTDDDDDMSDCACSSTPRASAPFAVFALLTALFFRRP